MNESEGIVGEDTVYRIHPAIGIARLGDAPDDFFIGPEAPGVHPPGARKWAGRVVRQAARFRVFAYRRQVGGGLVLQGEVLEGVGDVVAIRWTVHLANKKAAFFQFDGLKGEAGKYHDGEDIPPLPHRNPGDPKMWEIDPGERSITGKNAAAVRFDATTEGHWPKRSGTNVPVIDYLGELRTDDAGRLLVLGGRGHSASALTPPAAIPVYANNPSWFDDTSDGTVTAEVVVRENGVERVVPVEERGKAWCLVGPPDFAPEITPVVTLYDLLVDMAVRKLPLPADEAVYDGPLRWLAQLNAEVRNADAPPCRPDYLRDVFPLLERAVQFRWVHERASNAHFDTMSDPALADPSPDAATTRNAVFRRLRVPGGAPVQGQAMPRLLGDEPYTKLDKAPNRQRLSITPTQYKLLQRWRDGAFDPPPSAPPVPGASHAADTSITPWGLDRAALEGCIGGAFYPGIEAGWQMRHEELFIAPFRIDHAAKSTYLTEGGKPIGPGHFSRQMALPWQADFMDCAQEAHDDGVWGWWPAQRPDEVHRSGSASMVPWVPREAVDNPNRHEWMVANWSKMGVVLRSRVSDDFAEEGRDPGLP